MRQIFNPFGFVPDLWRNRTLLWQFTVRNVELRHRGSHLGFAWSVLNPLLMLALYVFVFGYVFRGRFSASHPETRIDYALGIFLGLNVFHLFAEVIAVAPTVIVANPNFVKKVVFPLAILPASSVGSSVFHAMIGLVLSILGIVIIGPGLSVYAIWLPFILLPLLALLLGIAWLLSAIGVFFRDISQMMVFITNVLLYASCILFPSNVLPHYAWNILRFNPILLAVEQIRVTVMWHSAANPVHIAYLYAIAIVTCVVGHYAFRKVAPAFADVL